MAHCIVTGGAGFIGSHLSEALLKAGHTVTVIDNLLLGKKQFVPKGATFYKKDIRDFVAMRRIIDGADVVFHLAADPRLPVSLEDPIGTHEINVTGTLHIFEAARLGGVKKVVFTSSAAVYNDESLPISEAATPHPKSPYGLHKYMGEQYARLYHRLFGLDVVCLRYFNVYGPRKLAGGSYPMVIPVFLQQKKDGKVLTITGDGEQTRDYVHVTDVVRANMYAWDSKVRDGRAINIANGEQVSVNTIAKLIGGETTHIPGRDGEIRFAEADTSLAKKLLGWKPTVSFADGIESLKKDWGL